MRLLVSQVCNGEPHDWLQQALADQPLGTIGHLHECESDSGHDLDVSGKND